MSDVETLRVKLGLPDAPLVRAGLQTTVAFFTNVLQESPMVWWEYLRGIDFHQPVRVELLPPGVRLAQHESVGHRRPKPFAYYTTPGTSPYATGTSFEASRYKLYETNQPTQALVSTASAIQFNDIAQGRFDRVSRPGGGRQYIIPTATAPTLVRTATV